MKNERGESRAARFVSQVQSALALESQRRQARRLAHEQGHVSIDRIPQDQEIVTFPQARECLDTKVFNQSVTRQWVDDANPREDAWSAPPSRIGPSA